MSKTRDKLKLKLEHKNSQREKEAGNWSEQCRIALDNKKYKEAVEFGNKALKLLPVGNNSSTKNAILYNMGAAYQTFDTVEALKCFEEIEKGFLPLSPAIIQSYPILKNVIIQKAFCQLANGNYKEAEDSIKKVGGAMEKILTLQIQLNNKNASIEDVYNKSLEIQTNDNQEKINLTLLKTAIYSLQGNTKMAINSIQALSNMNTNSRIEDLIVQSIKSFRIGGKFTEGIDFLNYLKKNYPSVEKSDNPFGLYDLFIIHENADKYDLATNYLIKLQKLTNLGEGEKIAVKLANTVRFYTELEKKNFGSARKILNNTELEFSLHNKMLSKLEQASIAEQAQASKVKINDNVLSNAIIEAEINNKTSSVSEVEEESKDEISLEIAEINPNDFDPKKIHEYFKHKKSLISKKSIEIGSEKASSWILPNGTKYDTKQTDVVHKVEGREHYYICIKNNLKLGSVFIDAMKKGMVSKSYSSTGIKFFNNSDSVECVELKINGGNRAWSKTMYMNPEGDYLVVIDGYGNHVAAGKAARAGMKIIETPSYSSPAVIVAEDTGAASEDYHYTTASSSEHKDHGDITYHDDLDVMGDVSAV